MPRRFVGPMRVLLVQAPSSDALDGASFTYLPLSKRRSFSSPSPMNPRNWLSSLRHAHSLLLRRAEPGPVVDAGPGTQAGGPGGMTGGPGGGPDAAGGIGAGGGPAGTNPGPA